MEEEVSGELVPDERPLPVRRQAGGLELGSDVASAALAAAGGIVAGAATVVAVRAARSVPRRRPSRRSKRSQRQPNVIASRSFLVDIHLLDR